MRNGRIFPALVLCVWFFGAEELLAASRTPPKRPKDEFAEKLAATDKDDPKALDKLASWCKKAGLKAEETQVEAMVLQAEYRQRHAKLLEAPEEKGFQDLLSWCRKKKLAECEESLKREWAERQYAEKAKALPADDLAAQLALGKWCQEQELYSQAVTHARAILRQEPKHAEARALLAKCVTKAKCKDRGLLRKQTVPGYDSPNAWYHIYVPAAHTAEKPMPLYIWLHGGHVGEGCADNTVSLHQVIPEFKANLSLFPNHIHHFWTHPSEMIYLLDTLDEVMLRFSVDPQRIYIMGGSMGGSGTFAMAANFLELFAACAPNSSWWEHTPIEKAAVMPIYIVHGSSDTTVPVKWGRDAYAKLKGLPGARVEYHELACGHQPPMEALVAAAKWISQFTNPRTFDMEELKTRCRALKPPAWANNPKYQ